MAELLLASFKNKREADLVAKLIGSMRTARVVRKGKNIEDMYLAELINEGMKEKRDIPIADFKKYLTRRIEKLKR